VTFYPGQFHQNRVVSLIQNKLITFTRLGWSIFIDSTTKKGFSAKEIQKQLGLKRYEPVWAMVHKLRKAMGSRD
ncbi:hypothetical protein ABE471_20240, partial [Elizabethkingia anophelis]